MKVRRLFGIAVPVMALVMGLGAPARADVEPLPVPSQWDVADLAYQNTMTGPSRQPCNYPSAPFYYEDGACKYAQAALYTSCAVKDSTGWCIRRRIDSALWRGGTADVRSYTPSGMCALGSTSDMGLWQLTSLVVTDNKDGSPLWSAPGSDYNRHSNCDVEHGPYYRPIGLVVYRSATVTFEFQHYCRSDASSCGGFPEKVHFGVVFSSSPRFAVETHV
jgi:hypothetical protein